MDVGNPSNFYRMMNLFEGDFDRLSNEIAGYAFTDDETRQAMKDIFSAQKYVLDPHGAVAYLGLKKFLRENGNNFYGIFAETAHPAKFKEVVDETLNTNIPIPAALNKFLQHGKKSIRLSNSYESFKSFLLENF